MSYYGARGNRINSRLWAMRGKRWANVTQLFLVDYVDSDILQRSADSAIDFPGRYLFRMLEFGPAYSILRILYGKKGTYLAINLPLSSIIEWNANFGSAVRRNFPLDSRN